MSAMNKQQLHWTQRVALVRHNLHAASRSGDFTFFKALQANAMMEGTNYVATLSAEMGDDADILLAAMDNLNAGMAYVHQDAFQKVFDGLKGVMRGLDDGNDALVNNKAKLYVDATMQRNMADMAIDKMTNSAIALVDQQPERVQEQAANVWITGLTIVADCIEVTHQQLNTLDQKMDDFIRMEESWNTVKASIISSVIGLKGVFSLMDSPASNPTESAPAAAPRNASIASAGAGMFRRLSNAFAPSAASSSSRASSVVSQNLAHSRSNSISQSNSNAFNQNSFSHSAPIYRTPNYVRNSVSAGCPTTVPPMGPKFDEHNWHSKLSLIPPTPAAEEPLDPFDTTGLPELPAIPADLDMAKLPETGPVCGKQSLIKIA